MKKEVIYQLISITCQILFIDYFILLTLDSISKGFVSYYLNMQIFLWLLLIFSVLFIFLKKKTSK